MIRPLRIHHVVASVLPEHGGPSYSVPALCDALAEEGHDITLHTFAPVPDFEGRRFAVRAYSWQRALVRSFGVTWDMPLGLRRAAQGGEIMHVHGLWMLPNLLPALAVMGTACKLVWSPRGMLDPWSLSQSAKRKRLLWRAVQGPAVRRAELLHATSAGECSGLRQLGLRAPVTIVPNGVDIPSDAELAHFEGRPRTLLFLSRIHPKKGIDALLRAWARVESAAPDWQLRIVGPDNDGYLSELRALVQALGARRVEFLPAAYGADKRAHFRSAQLYALPSHAENFGVGIAEALAYGVPAIAGRGTPWAALSRDGAGYHVDNSEEALEACLREALSRSPADLRAMGQRGRAFVAREYGWSRVASALSDSYVWLVQGGPPPICVERAPGSR